MHGRLRKKVTYATILRVTSLNNIPRCSCDAVCLVRVQVLIMTGHGSSRQTYTQLSQLNRKQRTRIGQMVHSTITNGDT